MEDLISVIVPVYKVEKYIRKCIDSIVNQTYKNLEIILVDDGSPDNCPAICDEYAKKDNRIKVIHKENGGLSDARNRGIQFSKGKYIAFVDSDDCVSENFILKMYEVMIDRKVSIVICDYKIFENEVPAIIESNNKVECIFGKDVIYRYIYLDSIKYVVAWNKLYKRELFDNIKFEVGKVHEDEFLLHKLFYYLDKVAVISQKLYYYRKTAQSITSVYNIKRLDVLQAFENRITFFQEVNDYELMELTLEQYLNLLIDNYFLSKKYLKKEPGITRTILEKFNMNINKYMYSNNHNVKSRIKFMMFRFNPHIFNLIISLYRKCHKKQEVRQ